MQKICLENISENEYKDFLVVLERLVSLPFSYRLATASTDSQSELLRTDAEYGRISLNGE